jgi:hypothetical protein
MPPTQSAAVGKRRRHTESVQGEEEEDAAEALRKERMDSVLRQKGNMWTTDLAYLLADRGDFAVVESDRRRWLAVLPKGSTKWIVDNGRGTAVPAVIDTAVASLRADLLRYTKDQDGGEEEEGDTETRFRISLDVDDELRKKYLPLLMVKQGRILEPAAGYIFCNDGKAVKDGKATPVTAGMYCVQTSGFSSKALLEKPHGFQQWYAEWQALHHSRVVDLVLASTFVHGKSVVGELRFPSLKMQETLSEVAGDYELCQPGTRSVVTLEPPTTTTPEFLVHAASLAAADLTPLPAITARKSTVAPDLSEVVRLATKAPPDVHAAHILYSTLRTSQKARESPKNYIVRMLNIKTLLEPAGRYRSKKEIERVLAFTFDGAPEFVDGNLDANIDGKGMVLTGCHAVRYMNAEIPRSWVPRAMKEMSDLVDEEHDWEE